MHLHRSRIGVALMGAVAIVALCSTARPAFAVEANSDGQAFVSATAAAPAAARANVALQPAGDMVARGDEGCACVDNQLCADAIVINNGDTLSGNSCEDDCCNDGSASCGSTDGTDVWYTYTAAVNGQATATTCAAFTDYDPLLSVHTECDGNVGNEIICNDDDCDLGFLHPTVTWDISAGTTYLIRVSGWGGACGDFDLTLTTEGCASDADCDDGDQCTDNFCVDGECQAEDNGECCPDCGTCTGDCCQDGGNGSPGCNDEACCDAICAADPFCCDTEWDGGCSDAANKSCDICGGGGGEGGSLCVDNQLCADAMVINDGDTLTGNSCEDHLCNDGSASCNSTDGNDVWYTYTAAVNGQATATTCAAFTDYDPLLSVHTECDGNVFDEIICNDDDCDLGFLHPTVTWDISAGTTYLIRVSGWGGACGDFDLTLTTESCVSDAACDDGDACTDDICDDGLCTNAEINCDDGDQCTDDFCTDGVCQNDDNGECCPDCGTCAGDVNCDGAVDPLDSGAILARFGLDPCNEENCRYDVNCDGAIDPLDSGYVLARFGQCNEPDVCEFDVSCPPDEYEATDNCEDAPVNDLSPGETLIFFGDNTGATATCDALGPLGETWHAFNLTEDADVSTDKCGTEPVWGDAFIVLDPECPCSGAFVLASDIDQTTCDDGNWTVNYDALPAGDYWAPELLDPNSGNEGPYVFNISASAVGSPPKVPANDDCADAVDLFDGVTAFDTNGATTDGVNPLPVECEKGFGLDIVNDIWYQYTATCTGIATMSTCDDANYDTRMAAYFGTGCPTDNEDLAGCNDDGGGCGGFTSIMEVSVVAGETYKIRLGGFAGSGTGNLTVSCP